MSHPTVQSMQFDVQFDFLLLVNSIGNRNVAFELDFDVEAPTFTPDVDGPGCGFCIEDEQPAFCDCCDVDGCADRQQLHENSSRRF